MQTFPPGRELGQIHIVLNPEFFAGLEPFLDAMEKMVREIHAMRPATAGVPCITRAREATRSEIRMKRRDSDSKGHL
jgi:malate dehydrogenase (NAD) (EC 1.1.1.37)